MQELFYKMLYFAIIYTFIFGATWLYGRRSFPKPALQLSIGGWIIMVVISYFSGITAGLLSVPVIMFLLFRLRKPNQRKALLQFFLENKIFSSKAVSKEVLEALGNKNWRFAAGEFDNGPVEKTTYYFLQGHTTHAVSAGQFTRTTTYQHYLAFIFPPGTAGNIFKQHALSAADKSGYTFWKKLKFQWDVDTDKPARVITAADGSFIIEYNTIPDLVTYTKQLGWIKEHFSKMYIPVTDFISAN